MVYIGLDLATVTGICVYIPERNLALVREYKGNAIKQLNNINSILVTDLYKISSIYNIYINKYKTISIVIEQLHNFRNANTVRLLLEMSGYIRYTLTVDGYTVNYVAPDVARSHLGTKSKEDTHKLFIPNFKGSVLTSNHTDALAIAIYQAHLDGAAFNLNELAVRNWE